MWKWKTVLIKNMKCEFQTEGVCFYDNVADDSSRTGRNIFTTEKPISRKKNLVFRFLVVESSMFEKIQFFNETSE